MVKTCLESMVGCDTPPSTVAELKGQEQDQRILAELRALLTATRYHSVACLEVRFHEGLVILSGKLNSWYELQLALEAMKRHEEVSQIEREVLIDYPAF